MIQLSSLKESYRKYKQDISDVESALFIEWCNNITGFVWDKLVNVAPDRYLKTSTISVANGQTNYTLPTDFRDISRIGTGLYPTDSQGNPVDNPLAITGYGSPIPGFYIEGVTTLVITPPPQASRTNILRYVPSAPSFTALTDYFSVDKLLTGVPLIRDEDREYLIRAIDVQYEMWDEDPSLEAIADQRFVRILDEMLSRSRTTPNSINMNDYNWAF